MALGVPSYMLGSGFWSLDAVAYILGVWFWVRFRLFTVWVLGIVPSAVGTVQRIVPYRTARLVKPTKRYRNLPYDALRINTFSDLRSTGNTGL